MPAPSHHLSTAEAPGHSTASAGKAGAWYRFLLLVFGILLLLGSVWLSPPEAGQWWIALILFPFIIFTSAFPLVILNDEISLAAIPTLGCAVLLSITSFRIDSPAAAGLV